MSTRRSFPPFFSPSIYLTPSRSPFEHPFTLHNPPPTIPADRRTVKRTTRSFALLSSFAGIKSVSLCRGSPSPLFHSRGLIPLVSYKKCRWETLEKFLPGRPLFSAQVDSRFLRVAREPSCSPWLLYSWNTGSQGNREEYICFSVVDACFSWVSVRLVLVDSFLDAARDIVFLF